MRKPRLSAVIHRGVWGICDQALISATNFVTTVVLARSLGPAAFGAFTLVYAAILFANGLQSALVTQPHNVLGSTREGTAYIRYTTTTAVSQICLTAVMLLIGSLCAGVAWIAHWGIASLVVAFVPALAAWQMQEFVRRVLYTEGRLKAAFANDIVSYGTQAIAIFTLGRLGRLTGERAFSLIALTSAVAAVWGLWEIRKALDWRGVRSRIQKHWFSENWRFGKWLFGAALALWVSSQLYPVLVGGLVSIAEAGSFRAVQTIMGPTHILLLAMDTALTPSASRAFAVGGLPALRSFIVRIMAMTAPIMLAYCLFIALFAKPILTVLYGTQYRQYSWLLILFALNYAFLYLRSPVVIALEAQRVSAPIFRAHLWSGLVVLTVGVAAVHLFGLLGAALGTVANALILNLILWQRYRRIVMGNTAAPRLEGSGVGH